MTLRQGNVVIRTTITNSLGSLQFTGVANGTYNSNYSDPDRLFVQPHQPGMVVSGFNRTGQNFTGTAIGQGLRRSGPAVSKAGSAVETTPSVAGTAAPTRGKS